MESTSNYMAILRCRSWHVWPEKTLWKAEPVVLQLTPDVQIRALPQVRSYLNRSDPARFEEEPTGLGPVFWRGEIPGLCTVRDSVLLAPEDVAQVIQPFDHACRGEIDIVLEFILEDELSQAATDSLQSAAFALMSLINLTLKEFLTPVGPLQVRKQNGPKGQITSDIRMFCERRESLAVDALKIKIADVANSLFGSADSERLRTALELYGAHLLEREARVRFLLLVMALEVLAKPSDKHPVVVNLLDRWQTQLQADRSQYLPSSPEGEALDSLEREVMFRRAKSIRSQIRALVSSCVDDDAAGQEMVRSSLKVYDLRSTLVHTGHLASTDVESGEQMARKVLERVLVALALERKGGSG